MKIEIEKELTSLHSSTSLIVLSYNAKVEKSSPELLTLIQKKIAETTNNLVLDELPNLPQIKATRQAYRNFGKAPTSYRNAAEAMLRRIIKRNGLYQINNVVDINNFMSISTGYSIGTYDIAFLQEPIVLKIASAGEKYQGIGKDEFNIENLPTLYDEQGAFGNPSSDSNRAMITTKSQTIVSVIYSFSKPDGLTTIIEEYKNLLTKYCQATNIQVQIIQ